ncbi:flavodoxin family protein [Desulfoluna butyratoxydans]|uniref:Nadph-dependent fmn reductase-like n=1 Tax=Desulfoluna butyratoxydans TaxID=231438 RepID=A0A4U8YSZ8_9BACT|nr:flavodoxin family protein [Desulfoluna butyratoxydans]VFQ47041.1 nadph-dependent fmn reductase-like [Desulfoluna butyratoxydans]
MNVIAINGSPRKEWNTATLIQKTLDGASSQGAETELIHLYDLDYKGCRSCFACKKKGGRHYGACAMNDELTSVLNKIEHTDALILGSPIYFGSVSGEMRCFLERALFPKYVYANPYQTLFPRTIQTGFIYTMNVTEEGMKGYGFDAHLNLNETQLEFVFGKSETLFCHDTYQFNNYDTVVQSCFDPVKKEKQRQEVFPLDCDKAFDMGRRFASPNQ